MGIFIDLKNSEKADSAKIELLTGVNRRQALIIENIQVNQHSITEMLNMLGLKSKAVCDARDALTLLTEEQFDLILIDMQLPGTQSFETIQRIRRAEAGLNHQRTPLIAVTAHIQNGEHEKYKLMGVNEL